MTEYISPSVSARMRRVRSRNTPPEIALRRALWARGLRYRTGGADLPGKPDIASKTRKLAVFVDGDYWHGGQWRRRGLACLEEQFLKAKRRDYWLAKIRRNMARDARVTGELLRMGWTVVRLWESAVDGDLERCADLVMQAAEGVAPPTGRELAASKSVADLSADVGLHRYALERHGWSVASANDIDTGKRKMHDAHFRDAASRHGVSNVHHIATSDVPSVTLALASFPCNDLSLAGSRQNSRGSPSAFGAFARVMDEMGARRPPLIMLANVPGCLTSNRGDDLQNALAALNDLGYSVDLFTLDARHFVPQSGSHVFVIATLDTCVHGRPDAPVAGTVAETVVRPAAVVSFIASRPQIRWAVRELPDPPELTLTLGDILDDLAPADDAWWSDERAKCLLSQMSPKHRAVADAMIAGDTIAHGAVCRRVHKGGTRAELGADGIAGCLRAPRGGSADQMLFQAGRGSYAVRPFTDRECARLMGVDEVHLDGSLNGTLFGFGDAVPAPVVEWIARYYLDPVVNEMIRGAPLRLED